MLFKEKSEIFQFSGKVGEINYVDQTWKSFTQKAHAQQVQLRVELIPALTRSWAKTENLHRETRLWAAGQMISSRNVRICNIGLNCEPTSLAHRVEFPFLILLKSVSSGDT